MMSTNAKDNQGDEGQPAALEDTFPSAADILQWAPANLVTAVSNGDVVLDTNVLLLPYVAGKESLDSIIKVYASIAAKGRLFIPARVIREFAKNRPARVGELLKNVMNQKSKVAPQPALQFPLLEGLPVIDGLRRAEHALSEAQKAYTTALHAVHDTALGWGWNDPVTTRYRDTFTPATCIVECNMTQEEVEKHRTDRYRRRVPPGYKDKAKDDGGIGDLLIWLTILQIGTERKKDLVFVTGEEKADWQYRSDGRGFLPRAELFDEYRRASGGRSIFIVALSHLLETMKADSSMVESVRKEEGRQRLHLSFSALCPECSAETACKIGNVVGDSSVVSCRECNARFHVHRTRTGIRVQRYGAREKVAVRMMIDWFQGHFQDPAEGVPYDAAEGGYLYTAGGPFDALEVLTEHFGPEYPEAWIAEAACQVEVAGTDWVRRGDY